MAIRIYYVIRMCKRGDDAPTYEVISAPCGLGCATVAIERARELNKRNEASWYHYFASQYLPEDFP